MERLDLTLPDLIDNLATDEALLMEREELPELGEILRFWEVPAYAVVLGSGGIVADDVNIESCNRDGVPIARRSSGGGTVLLGRGCLLYSLVLDMESNSALAGISTSYEFIMRRMAAALAVGATVEGACDLAIAGLKFSGNAQQRKRRFLLHHGTILLNFDLTQTSRYLKLPPRQPEYRAGRDHGAFIRNLDNSGDDIKDKIARAWGALNPGNAPSNEILARCLRDRFLQPGWVFRR